MCVITVMHMFPNEEAFTDVLGVGVGGRGVGEKTAVGIAKNKLLPPSVDIPLPLPTAPSSLGHTVSVIHAHISSHYAFNFTTSLFHKYISLFHK